MFRSHQNRHQTASYDAQPRVISMLAEDVKSFAKVKSADLVEEIGIFSSEEHKSGSYPSKENIPLEKPAALL